MKRKIQLKTGENMNNSYTVINLLKRAARLFPNSTVNGTITYSRMYDDVRKISMSLGKMGAGNGKRIAVADFNSIEFMEMLFACSLSGSIVYPINIKFPVSTAISTVREAGAEYLVASEPFLKAGFGEQFRPENIISLSENSKYVSFKSLLGSDMQEEDVNKGDNSYSILYTSGTTGSPKEIIYDNSRTVNGAMSILYQLGLFNSPAGLDSNDTILSLIPFYHIWSWGSAFHAAYLGSNLVLSGRYEPQNILGMIKKYHVTWLNAVPTMVYDLINNDVDENLNGLKMLIGGSPVNRGLTEKLRAKNIRFSTIYGGTDMLATAVSINKGKKVNWDYIRTTTHPVPMVNIKIMNEKGVEVETGNIGEVYVNSPWLPDGYLNRSKSPEYEKGWFRTGDVGTMDSSGGVRILDRSADVIKSGGEWIPTSIIESIISEIPGITNCAVIGVSDEKWGESPLAFIESNQDVDIQKIMEALEIQVKNGIINKWWIPKEFRSIKNIPLTSTGKIDKKALRNMP